MKGKFDAEFEAASGLEKNRVKECNKFKQQEFAKLSEDEKEKWSEVVRLEWEEAKRLIEERDTTPRLLEPADAQKYFFFPFSIVRVLTSFPEFSTHFQVSWAR